MSTSSSSESSSSYSTSSSSSSSLSSQSRSSVSSYSSSSSSSIDSSTSSSESIGNTSTSSSSSFGGWNKSKPFILGMSAINSATVLNRLAQTISLIDTTYSVGKAYCYLYPNGDYNDYTIHLDIYTCDSLGRPETIIASQTLAGSNVTQNGWYSFDFSITGITPTNKYMSFVLWQENGNEDDYVLWGYNFSDMLGTKAWISDDVINWVQHDGVVRALKIVGSFSAFDLTNHRILTPPTTNTIVVGDFEDGTYDGTKLVAGGSQYESDKVEIDYSKLLTSFVVDSSGSMGWNDRFGTRKTFIQNIIQTIKNNYSSSVLFDIVKFGALVANTSSVTTQLGSAVTINLDLNTPTRTTHRFVVSAATASKGDVYSANGNSFTVIQDVDAEDAIFCMANLTPPPFESGILSRVSGSGDLEISYDSYTVFSIFDPIVAYGFKNLEDNHAYDIGTIDIGGAFTSEVSLLNWQTLTPFSVTLSVGANGPNSANTLDFTTASGMVLRKALSLDDLDTTQLISDVAVGSNVASVVDTSNVASIGQYVDIFDKDIASLGMMVANVTATALTFYNESLYDISKWSTNSGLVQVSNLSNPVNITSTTAKLLVKDAATTRNVTFFLQTINGLSIEWDFQPFEEWIIYNLFWNDETAILPITISDSDGNPFPDGTKIVMYVGGYPDDSQINQISATLLTEDASAGTFRLDVESTSGYSAGQEIDVVNNDREVQTVEISSVGSDYIIVSDPLTYDFNVADGSRIIPHITEQDQIDATTQVSSNVNLLSDSLGFVDATPIYVGKSLDTSLLKPYDPTPISPSASYSDLLLDEDRIRSYGADIPTIDGKIFVQVLPITEDNDKTIKQKELELDKIIRPSTPPIYTSQFDQNEDDPSQAEESLSNAAASVTTTTTTATIIPLDYDIESPVYLSGGTAQSSMTTYANDYTPQTFDGINVPGVSSTSSSVIMAKTYSIYPAIVVENETNGMVLAKQYLAPFEISFTPSVWIFSNCSVDQIPITQEYWSEPDEGCDLKSGRYNTKTEYLSGVYADSGKDITIDYTVTYQGELANDMTLTVKIYSNVNQSSETLSCSSYNTPTNQYFNSVLPNSTRTTGSTEEEYQPLTTIDQWRSAVNSNPASQIIGGTDEDQDVSSKAYADTITGQYQDFLVGTLGMDDVVGDSFDPDVPEVLDGTQFYINPWEWTNATQYGDYQEQTVNIVNGKASITIPASDVVATLFVEASVKFGQNNEYETIRADHVAIANPINIAAISPYNIEAQGGATKYELGTNIRWYNNVSSSVISNISVSFSPSTTPCLPSVAKTDSEGYAAGIRIGPHHPIVMNCPDAESEALECRCYGEYESISITVSKLAYTRTVIRHIEWTSPLDKEYPADEDSQFYFICTESGYCWADSVSNSGSTTITSDMGWIENDLWVNSQYPNDGTLRIGCGEDQLEETPTPLSPTRVWPFQCDLYFVLNNPRWLPTSCGDLLTLSSTFSATVYGINQNVGNIKSVLDENEFKDNRPWKWKINVGTYYHYTNSDGERKARIGTGCVAPGPYEVPAVSGGTKLVVPRPMATIVEPLGIAVTTEAYDGELIRNGSYSPSIVAEVTWKGQPITNWFTTSDGTAIEYPFPQVAFQAGVCLSENGIAATDTSPSIAKDHRGKYEDCFSIGNNPDISLSSYSVTASLSRTDINTQGSNIHTHACTVDKYGNGITTQTIVLAGSYEDHTHTITNYVGLTGGTVAPHSHTLRCVAVTNLNPIVNSRVDVAINAYAYYDPTSCEPYSSSTLMVDDPYSDGSMGNRMMFGTFRFYSNYKDKQLLLSVSAPYGGWTSNNVTDETKTIDVEISAYWSEYSVEDSPGHWTIVPSQDVADGTRITFNISAYKPSPQDNLSVMVVRPDAIKEYMYVEIKASAKVDGYESETSKVITVRSSLQWIPGKKALFFEPTDDDIYIAQAIDQIDTIGASPMHDGVNYAAQRIIDFQTSHTDWKSAKKVILLLTDGDENSSQRSITQAINSVNFIDGKCEVPVIPVRLGYSHASDEVLTAKYALDTCGESWYMINATDSEILQTIDDIIMGDAMTMNSGVYTNTIDLGSSNLPSSVYLRNFVIPTGSRITYRVRTSTDGVTWLDWSEWYDSSDDIAYEINISVIGRYFQYQVKLYGNELFETPYITAGATIDYYKAQTLSVFFQPVEVDIDTDQYVASIHITHTGSIPETSIVNYGFSQFNTTDINDYYGTTSPFITPDRHTILLTRYNETFLTQDYQTYTAINGGWPDSAAVEVYRVNDTSVLGELIDPTTYAINNRDGKITFYNVRSSNDMFVLCVNFDSVFRIIMNAINYGPDSAIIDHIGIMYNVTKRIPKDSLGNIIHTPINTRI